MLNQVIGILRPTSTRGAILSSCLSMLSSSLGAKSVATGTLLFSGLMCLPHNQAAKVITEALVSLMFVPQIKSVQAVHAVPPRPVMIDKMAQKEMARRLHLHSFMKEYNWVFSGTVTCGEGPCQTGQVKVHLTSKKNPQIIRSASIQPDGTYQITVSIREVLNEHVDWWIVADTPESAPKQLQGREILMDDTKISIENPIRLL